MSELVLRDFTVAEFRGNYPQIDIDGRVDIEALTAGDENPFFVTLPIAKVGAVSENGLELDEELVRAIEEQAVGRGGLMGHIKHEERSTAFPIEVADWVGVGRVADILWGKAYIPPGAVREFIRRLKSRGGKLSTSIYGPYDERLPGKTRESFRVRGLRLESIDLAPADRAALKLGGGFAVTAQMAQGEDPPEVSMTREELLAELTAKDIPQTIREAIIQEHQAQNDQATQLAELRQERDDAQTLVTELQNVVAGYKAAEFEAGLDGQIAELINWNIQDETAKAKVDAFKRTVRGRILAELGTERDAEKLKAVVETVWEEMKPLAETIRDALAGPAAMVNGRPRNSRQIDDSPEARQKARSWVGI